MTPRKLERAVGDAKRVILEVLLLVLTLIAAYKLIKHELQSAKESVGPTNTRQSER